MDTAATFRPLQISKKSHFSSIEPTFRSLNHCGYFPIAKFGRQMPFERRPDIKKILDQCVCHLRSFRITRLFNSPHTSWIHLTLALL